MAVQQNKKSPSRRNMRRNAKGRPTGVAVTTEKIGGDRHLRHHIAANGYYRGREIIAAPVETDSTEE